MGGVAAFIRQRRLRGIHALLAAPHERRRISEIAFHFGFANNSHFSRTFRNTFGYSPREAREAATNDELLAARTLGTSETYARWIRRIGA
jgi:AraC-like DNA-binding protein